MKILFKALVGSQAYGCSLPTSDNDFKFVYSEDLSKCLGFGYRPQIELSKDDMGFEVKRFFELLTVANPTALELLYSPEDCFLFKAPDFDEILQIKQKFLTKKCKDSFGGYAAQQIRKAKGLDKKMNWEKDRVEKRDPIDFCHVIINGKTFPFKSWLVLHDFKESEVGLVGLDKAPHCYAVYIGKHYRGVFGKNSDFIVTSSVPINEVPFGVVVYNVDHYKKHLKEWQSYQEWLANRNMARFVDCANHDQKIDGKNLLHCRRLLDMAAEIPEKGLIVRRPNREYLLQIRRGEVNLDDIITKAEEDILKLNDIYSKSDLPDDVSPEDFNSTILKIKCNCF